MVSFKDSWQSHCDLWRAEHQKTSIRRFLNVVLAILSLNIQRLVSYSESRIKLTKQKLFSADCFCSFLPKFQIFWREIVRSPTLMALPSLCLDIAHNYFDFKAHFKNGCKSHNSRLHLLWRNKSGQIKSRFTKKIENSGQEKRLKYFQ